MLKPSDHIHFIGIGGTGLSAIARVLHESGYRVSGSDRQASPLSDALRETGVTVMIGHEAANVTGAGLVVRSSAVPDDNVEVRAARQQGIPVLKRSDFLGALMAGKTGVAIAGTHGKTTTTSLAAWLFSDQALDPTFIIGGVVADLGTNARAGRGEHFVIEADEYDRMFLGLAPKIAVITNVEHDHPDLFPTEADFREAFEQFVDRLLPDGILIACGDDAGARRLADRAAAQGRRTLTYGLEAGRDLQAVQLEPVPGAGFSFEVRLHGQPAGRISLRVPGRHNVLNALAVFGIGLQAGLTADRIAASLGRFTGVGRRFELLGEAGGVVIVDDYAHHPTEIRATISAARARYPGRPLWVTWQPHTFSRVALLSSEFSASFGEADHVVVTDVYAARESRPEGFSLKALVAAMGHPDARQIDGLEAAAQFLTAKLTPGSVLLVLSAGDADRISRLVYNDLSGQINSGSQR